jgi:hypothetical protein
LREGKNPKHRFLLEKSAILRAQDKRAGGRMSFQSTVLTARGDQHSSGRWRGFCVGAMFGGWAKSFLRRRELPDRRFFDPKVEPDAPASDTRPPHNGLFSNPILQGGRGMPTSPIAFDLTQPLLATRGRGGTGRLTTRSRRSTSRRLFSVVQEVKRLTSDGVRTAVVT